MDLNPNITPQSQSHVDRLLATALGSVISDTDEKIEEVSSSILALGPISTSPKPLTGRMTGTSATSDDTRVLSANSLPISISPASDTTDDLRPQGLGLRVISTHGLEDSEIKVAVTAQQPLQAFAFSVVAPFSFGGFSTMGGGLGLNLNFDLISREPLGSTFREIAEEQGAKLPSLNGLRGNVKWALEGEHEWLDNVVAIVGSREEGSVQSTKSDEGRGPGSSGSYFIVRDDKKLAIFKPKDEGPGSENTLNKESVRSKEGINPEEEPMRECVGYLVGEGFGVPPTAMVQIASHEFRVEGTYRKLMSTRDDDEFPLRADHCYKVGSIQQFEPGCAMISHYRGEELVQIQDIPSEEIH